METETETELLTPKPHDPTNLMQPQPTRHPNIQRNPYSSHHQRSPTRRTQTKSNQPKSQHYQSQKSLQTWLHFARKGISTDNQARTLLPSPNHEKHENDTTDSNHWGDPILKEKGDGIIRVLSRNVDTLSIGDDCLAWEAAAQALHEYQVDIASFQETNVNWNPAILRKIQQILLKESPNAQKW